MLFRSVSRSIRGFVGYSVVFATVSCLVGIVAPMQYNIPVPSGGAIILVAATLFAITTVLRNVQVAFRAASVPT